MNRLTDLTRQLNSLTPDDVRTHMLRAILENEIETRFNGMLEDMRAADVQKLTVSRLRLIMHPYLPEGKLKVIMSRHFQVLTNRLPILLPPKYWGLHILPP